MENENRSFEERLESVQKIIHEIEEGRMSLEDSVRSYEAGMKELNQLDAELKNLTRRLTVLRDGVDGPEEVPMEEAR